MHPISSSALLLALAATLHPLAALAEKPTPAASREIEYLIEHLKASDCQFMRNGTWYEPGKAAAHLRQKYDYLLKKDLVELLRSQMDMQKMYLFNILPSNSICVVLRSI